MITGDGIKVLEFNARFGDPETQVILPLLDMKLGDLLKASVDGKLKEIDLKFKKAHAMTVVVAAGGYPGDYDKGKVISGLDNVSDKIMVFHAGTDRKGGDVVTSGGRVLNVTAFGDTLKEAKEKIYAEIDKIKFDGLFTGRI
jgi:phosphoribosylamine--glycine ligase